MRFRQLMKLTIAAAAIALLAGAVWGQEQQEKSPWKDRAEYDLYNSIVKEQDPNKKIQLLNTYMEKYPGTNFKLNVYLMYSQTYNQLEQYEKLYEYSQKILELDPKNFQGLYFATTAIASMGKTEPEYLANGEKVAKALLEQVQALKKPEGVSDADWKKQRDALLILGHQTLGWIAMTRKNNEEAERYFREVLQIEPRNGQVSYWLGTVIIAQRDPEKQSEAFYHFARAAALDGQGAMPSQNRQQVEAYLRKIYTSFHGDESGLDEIMTMAKQNPFPPSGFEVKSKEQIAIERENKLREENPMLYMWRNVKNRLTASDGMDYFNREVKNSAMPSMRGYLISQSPPERPHTLVLGIEDRGTREVTLRLGEENAYRYPAPRGTPLRFQCVPQDFSQDPFNLVFSCAPDKIDGWPPPPARRPAR